MAHMPPSADRLSHDLQRLRSGHGATAVRLDLRERLGKIDSQLREARRSEALRLANLRHRLNTSDTRQPDERFAALQRAAEESAARLAALDGQIIDALRRLGP
jgi:hypothetical protein